MPYIYRETTRKNKTKKDKEYLVATYKGKFDLQKYFKAPLAKKSPHIVWTSMISKFVDDHKIINNPTWKKETWTQFFSHNNK